MYNFYSQHRRAFYCIFGIATIIITVLLLCFSPTIFQNESVFFYTSSSIVQGFVALVAFLGAVVVFKVQLEDQAMRKLSDSVEGFVDEYDGDAHLYTPTQMMNACQKIIEGEKDFGSKDFIKKVYNKMKETISSRNEVRTKMVDFTVISFLNIAIALTSILFAPILVKFWCVGGFLLSANVFLSVFCLGEALQTVKKAVGYDFLMK